MRSSVDLRGLELLDGRGVVALLTLARLGPVRVTVTTGSQPERRLVTTLGGPSCRFHGLGSPSAAEPELNVWEIDLSPEAPAL